MRKPFKCSCPRKQPSKDYYECKNCDHTFPKKDSAVSGWKDHPHGFHVHCPKCGATIDQHMNR